MQFDPNIPRIVNQPGQFSYENGITVTLARAGWAEGVLEAQPTSINPHGTIHGGCLYTLADTVSGTAAAGGGVSCVTVSGNMEFLHPATGPRITCVASAKKLGHTLAVMNADLTDAEGTLVATGTFTFYLSPLKKD